MSHGHNRRKEAMASTPSTKRKRTDGADPDEDDGRDDDSGDPVIGIDCGGQVFFTHKSTLTAGSAYFAARFGGTFSAGSSRKDEHGQTIYFVDADPDTFRCILSYLRRGVVSWPDWADDPKFHQRLVAEAEYFGLDAAIVEKLKRVASIKYDPENRDGRGIFYWLGCSYGRKEYRNPYDLGEVSFSGTCIDSDIVSSTDIESHKRKFIQHRPKSDGIHEAHNVHAGVNCDCSLLWCESAIRGDKLVIKFKRVAISPTHYSLRYEGCFGMSDWDFEASTDGNDWKVLHKARNDTHIKSPSGDLKREIEDQIKIKERRYRGAKVTPEEVRTMKIETFTGFAEERLRHTWELEGPPSSFYRFFRITGPGVEGTEGHGCLHGIGFELYGDVQALQSE